MEYPMQIQLSDFVDSLVKLIVRFEHDGTNQQSVYQIFDSPAHAGLNDCVCGCTNDFFPLSRMRCYDEETDDLSLFSNNASNLFEPEDERSGNQRNSSSFPTDVDERIKYVEVHLPISKPVYKKILEVSSQCHPYFTLEEIYEVIISNVFSVLDNRIPIVYLIVVRLESDQQLCEDLYAHHCNKIYSLLKGIQEFPMDMDGFIELFHSENYFDELRKMLNELKEVSDDKLTHNMILGIHLHALHWENSFLNLVQEAKRSIFFVLIDEQGQRAIALPIDSAPHIQVLETDIDDFNASYMVHNLIMSCCFLRSNERVLNQKFNSKGAKSSLKLTIEFEDEVVLSKNVEQARTLFNKLLSCEFVCGDHVAELSLHFRDLNIELDTVKISKKKCCIYLDNCGTQLLQSLPNRTVGLYMNNMVLTETLSLGDAIKLLGCENVVMENGGGIVINEKCVNVNLKRIEGVVRCGEFGIINCLKNSSVTFKKTSDNMFSSFRITNACCESDFNCNKNIECLKLRNICIMPSFTMNFAGECRNILVDNCDGIINFEKTCDLDRFMLMGSPSSNLFSFLPSDFKNLHILEAFFDEDLVIVNTLHTITVEKVKVKNGCTLKFEKDCDRVKIKEFVGTINLFDKIQLKGSMAGSTNREFILQKCANNDMLSLHIAYMSIKVETIVSHNIANLRLGNVELEEPIVLNTNQNIDRFIIGNFEGTVILTGVINGTFFDRDAAARLMITWSASKCSYKVRIKNLFVIETIEISCGMEELILSHINGPAFPGFRISGNCVNMELNGYTGFINILSGPCLGMSLLENAFLQYNEAHNSLTIRGAFDSDTCFLPRGIKHFAANGLVVSPPNVFHLHENLENIEISNCMGTWNFYNLFNINSVELHSSSSIRMKNLQTQRVYIYLNHLVLTNSLIVDKSARKLILKNITAADGSIVRIDSCCQLISVNFSVFEIHWPILTQSHKVDCRINETYELKKIGEGSSLAFKLSCIHLKQEVIVPGNVESVYLSCINGSNDSPIILDSACKHLTINYTTGTVICPALDDLKTLCIFTPDISSLEIRFMEKVDVVLKICYIFEDEEFISVTVYSTNLQCLLFKDFTSCSTMKKLLSSITHRLSLLGYTTTSLHSKDGENGYDSKATKLEVVDVLKHHCRIEGIDYEQLPLKNIARVEIHTSAYNRAGNL